MVAYKVIFYFTSKGKRPVLDFIEQLDVKKSQPKIYALLKLLEEQGHRLGRPYVGHVRGKIKELRTKTSEGDIRIFFFFFLRRNIIMLHLIKKKTQKLPKQDIKTAEQRMRDFIVRYERGEFK